MLQDIRDNSQGVIAKIIIGLIVAVFALFGVESIIGGFITAPPVAEVNGEEISEIQLENSTQQLLASIGGNLDALDPGLVRQIALNQLVEEMVLRQSAERTSMTISDDRIDEMILETQAFQINGVFDPDLAIRTMAAQGMNAPLYRESLQQRMIMSQLANAYSASNFVIGTELSRIAALEKQSRSFRYIPVTLGTRTLGTAISDEEIQAYYDANQQDFSLDETVSVSYVVLDKNAIFEEIEVEESQIEEQYEVERDSFEGASEKRAAHILFDIAGSEADTIAAATAARQRILDGEDFGVVALELSVDTISAEEGGDIGYTDGSAFPAAVEEALTVLGLNEISEPVVSEFGVHLIKLTEDAENVFPPIEEARERIEREIKSSEVELIYAERLEDLSNLAFETGDLLAISEDLGLETQTSDAFPRNGGSGFFANPAVVAEAFSDSVLLQGNNSEVVELNPSQSIVLRLLQYTEATVEPFDEVKPQIAVIIRTEMETEATQVLGDEIRDALAAGEPVDEILSANELEWIVEEGAQRSSLNLNREIIDQVFSMPAPAEGETETAGITLANGSYAVVELNQVNAGQVSDLEESEQERLQASLLQQLGNRDIQAFVANLREAADVESNLGEDELF